MVSTKPTVDKLKLAEEAAELSRAFKPALVNFLKRGEGIGAGATNPVTNERNLGPFTRSQNSSQSPQPSRKAEEIYQENLSDLTKSRKSKKHIKFVDSLEPVTKSSFLPKDEIVVDLGNQLTRPLSAVIQHDSQASFGEKPNVGAQRSEAELDMLRQEMQTKINEAWAKKMKQMKSLQEQQEQQRKDLNEQTQNFNVAMSQSLTSIADKFVTGLSALTGKVSTIETKLKQSEQVRDKSPQDNSAIMNKFQEAIQAQ
jgi:hypothetical protein